MNRKTFTCTLVFIKDFVMVTIVFMPKQLTTSDSWIGWPCSSDSNSRFKSHAQSPSARNWSTPLSSHGDSLTLSRFAVWCPLSLPYGKLVGWSFSSLTKYDFQVVAPESCPNARQSYLFLQLQARELMKILKQNNNVSFINWKVQVSSYYKMWTPFFNPLSIQKKLLDRIISNLA